MEKAVREAIAEFEKKGITDDDLAKFKASREANLIYSLESVSGKVSKLASYFTFTGNGNYIKTEMERNNALTKADVMRYKAVRDELPLIEAAEKAAKKLARPAKTQPAKSPVKTTAKAKAKSTAKAKIKA